MIWKALRKGLSVVARGVVILLVLGVASPALGRTSAYEDEDKNKYWNPWVVPYVITCSLTGGVMWVVLRSSRRNPL